MKLDSTFAREIKALNGDGTREARFALRDRIDVAKKEMSSFDILEHFNEYLSRYGRAIVGLCVAATLYKRRERLDFWGFDWATAVLNLWTNRSSLSLDWAYTNDQLHPTRICEYAGSFIRLTSETE